MDMFFPPKKIYYSTSGIKQKDPLDPLREGNVFTYVGLSAVGGREESDLPNLDTDLLGRQTTPPPPRPGQEEHLPVTG